MFRLKNLDRWRTIPTNGFSFKNAEPRTVRLEVLAEDAVYLYVAQGKDSPQFIGTFHGYDVVEFEVGGPWKLASSKGKVQVHTPELDGPTAVEIPDAVTFTKIVTRRQRNPELELMMSKMSQNMERRLAQVTNDLQLAAAADRRAAVAEAEERRREEQTEREEREAAALAAKQKEPPAGAAGS